MLSITKTLTAFALAAVVPATAAFAATVSFDLIGTTDGGPHPGASVLVDDDTAGVLTFTISSSGEPGRLTGIFVEAGDAEALTFGIADIGGSGISGFAEDTNNLGGGVNLNGGFGSGDIAREGGSFDFGFKTGAVAQGPKGLDVSTSPFVFTVDAGTGLTLGAVDLIGLRFQSTGSGGQGSSKQLLAPAVVPVPAAGALLLLGLGGLAAAGRRRRA